MNKNEDLDSAILAALLKGTLEFYSLKLHGLSAGLVVTCNKCEY